MSSPIILAFLILAGVIAIPFAIFAIVYLVVPAFKGLWRLLAHVGRFIGGEVGDLLRIVGAAIAIIVLIPLTVLNVLIGRWSASAHFGRAIQSEGLAIGRCIYRVAIGHPARLLGLTPLTEGIEKRIPDVVAASPGADRPNKRQGQFEGYTIIGSLPGGGSGGRLYIAEPSAEKIAVFARNGQTSVGRVVIKSFSLADGSTLPQIVRENRALPAAKRLGLILEHDLTEERFFYVTRYVPGDSLGIVTQRLHGEAGAGLGAAHLRTVCSYAGDLLRTLTHYHEGGLWHKDVKPDNIIVADGRAHLVDFGLVTPLRSSMTLTTHGTEYFRDPEMVRMALRGVKVHEVDGAKFDIYAAGAVLYSMIENSFPAHGGLSQITKPCPEALRWVVRRAMTDYDKRYESAAMMLEDLETICRADDPFAVKPVALPSMRGVQAAHHGAADQHGWEGMQGAASPFGANPVGAAAAAGAGAAAAGAAPSFGRKPGPVASVLGQVGEYVDSALNSAGIGAQVAAGAAGAAGAAAAGAAAAATGGKPRIRVTSWWTGKYTIDPPGAAQATPAGPIFAAAAPPRPPVPPVPPVPPAPRNPSSAAEQLVRARARAGQARERAHRRMSAHSRGPNIGLNLGVGLAVLVFLGACGLLATGLIFSSTRSYTLSQQGGDSSLRQLEIGSSGVKVTVSRSAPTPGRATPAASPTPRTPDAPDAPLAPLNVLPAVGAGPSHGIVVLRDPIAYQEPHRSGIDAALGRLRDAGFSLVGGAIESATSQDDELIADLRNAIGVTPFETAESSAAIRAWLSMNPDLSAVLWLGRHEGGQATAWLVGREGLDESTLDAATNAVAGVEPRSVETPRRRGRG